MKVGNNSLLVRNKNSLHYRLEPSWQLIFLKIHIFLQAVWRGMSAAGNGLLNWPRNFALYFFPQIYILKQKVYIGEMTQKTFFHFHFPLVIFKPSSNSNKLFCSTLRLEFECYTILKMAGNFLVTFLVFLSGHIYFFHKCFHFPSYFQPGNWNYAFFSL